MVNDNDIYDHLAHYGVKGMRWGVRKDRRGSGGKSSKSSDNKVDKKSGQIDKAEFESFTKEQKFGSMNKPEPKVEDQSFWANITPEQKKAALIFGATVVAAGAAYGLQKKYGLYTPGEGQNIKDILLEGGDPFSGFGGPHKDGLNAYANLELDLPSGTIVSRVSSVIETNIRPGGFYAAHELHDVESYISFLGGVGGHINNFEATKPIRVASTKDYITSLAKAMDHPDIIQARGFNPNTLKRLTDQERTRALQLLAKQELSKNDFAFSLNSSTVDGLLPSRFVDEIKSAGFTSVIDYNNTSRSIAQAPVRHLDGSIFKVSGATPITRERLAAAKDNTDRALDMIEDFYDSVKQGIIRLFEVRNAKVESHLAHYGVKGMRWGIRKDRRGSGRAKGSAAPKKDDNTVLQEALQIQRGNELGQKYGPGSLSGKGSWRPKELTPEQKEQLKKYAKRAAIAGAAAGVAYLMYKGNQQVKAVNLLNQDIPDGFNDFMLENNTYKLSPKKYSDLKGKAIDLPEGTIVKRVSTIKESKIRSEGFYAAISDDDVNRYKAALPTYWAQWGIIKNPPSGQVVNIRSNTRIKAPSEKEAFKLWKEYTHRTDAKANDFAEASIGWANKNDKAAQGFLSFVKSKGYNALIDTNDAGSLSELPIRFLNGNDFSIVGHDALDLDGIRTARETIKVIAHFFMEKGLGLILDQETYLEHYGVKGMKWGVRKDQPNTVSNNNPKVKKGKAAVKKKKKKRKKEPMSNLEKGYLAFELAATAYILNATFLAYKMRG